MLCTMETRSGVIQSIVLKNFLCHRYLKVDFEKSINFIVGHNGSGKSAILDALILGLGGKAHHTQRNRNIQSYVQTNAEFASIEIKIKNNGPNAYKYNEYGDYITIIREIKDTGCSTYKVKSASDNVISNKYSVVESILCAYNIQMDNPVSVLPQKATKEFNDLNDERKYRFFLRATNLAQSEENYNKALEECSEAEKILEKKYKDCGNYKEELTKWEEKKKNIELKEQCQADIMQLNRELNWSKIRKLEDELIKKEKFTRMKKEQWARKDKLVQRLLNIDDSPLNELKNNLKSKTDEITILQNEKNRLDEQVSTLLTKIENTQMSENKLTNIIASVEEKVKGFNTKLQDIKSGSAAQRHEEAVRLEKEASAQLQETNVLLETAEVDADLADKEYARAQELLLEAQAHQKQLEKNKENEERELESIGDPVAKYGACAARLHERVRADVDCFRQPPRGPVGIYLSVKDEVWSGALEHILGNAFGSYCVDNSEDAKKLHDIIDEVYEGSQEARPDVSCCRFLNRKHVVRVPRLEQGACCALSVLDVDDVVVYNYLVDEFALETILLVETEDEAMQLCQRKQNVPQNCSMVVTCECSEYYPAPRYRCYGGEGRRVRFLHGSAQAALRELREQRVATDAALAAAGRGLRARTAAHDRACARQAQARDLEAELRRRMQDCKAELARRRDELQQLDVPQLEELQEEINISKQHLERQRQKKDEIKQQQRNFSNKIKETKQELNNVEIQLDCVDNEIKNINETLEKLKSECDKKQLEIGQIREKHKKTKEILNHMEKYLKSKRSTNEELIKKLEQDAMKDGPRIENPRRVDELIALLQEKDAELYSFPEELVDCDLDAKLESARKNYHTVSTNLAELEKLIEETTSLVESHLRPCLVRLNCVSLHVKNRFQAIIKTRGIKGKLHIDNVLRKLWFDQGGRNASGGERTFALVAFLVALQDCVDMPFFFMDEFNLFLDGDNYKKAVELLLAAARMRPGCQYVFITPNEPPGLHSSSDLDIQTMSSLVEQRT